MKNTALFRELIGKIMAHLEKRTVCMVIRESGKIMFIKRGVNDEKTVTFFPSLSDFIGTKYSEDVLISDVLVEEV